MTTTSEMTFEIERAARMKTELLTARLPSCAAAPAASSLTNSKYERTEAPSPRQRGTVGEGGEKERLDVSRPHVLLGFGRDQQEHLAFVERRVVLVEVVDGVGQLGVADVVAAAP